MKSLESMNIADIKPGTVLIFETESGHTFAFSVYDKSNGVCGNVEVFAPGKLKASWAGKRKIIGGVKWKNNGTLEHELPGEIRIGYGMYWDELDVPPTVSYTSTYSTAPITFIRLQRAMS